MDTLNSLAYVAGYCIVFHPVRTVTVYVVLLALAVAGIVWTSRPEPEEP